MLQVPQEVVRILVVAFRARHTSGYARVATYYSFLPLVIRTNPTHHANTLLPSPELRLRLGQRPATGYTPLQRTYS
jgi:hypothetical protein